MIYRKAPGRPVRLLLKVAAVSTFAAAACGGVVDDQGLHGTVASCQSGDPCEHDDAGVGGGIAADAGNNPCAQGCGLVPSTYDGGDDAEAPDDAGVLGVVVNMDAGEEDDASIVVGVVPHR